MYGVDIDTLEQRTLVQRENTKFVYVNDNTYSYCSINAEELEKEEQQNKQIRDMGQVTLDENSKSYKVELLTIIGEVEGHESAPSHSKTTKYEHVLPKLAMIEDDQSVDGLLVLLNTVGGDVEAGLAIAEMIAGMSIPSVTLVLGGSHSIGVPLAVSSDYSFIVPTATMMIHPVRMTGLIIGVSQTFDYFKRIQERIVSFVVSHSQIRKERLTELMLETGELTKDVGSILVGEQAVREGLIDETGGIQDAFRKLHQLMKAGRD